MIAFGDELAKIGLRLKGPPNMAGQMHRVAVEGDRGKKTSGSYKGYLDGTPAGYAHNFKTGEEIRWKASGNVRSLTAEEREKRRQQIEANARACEAERKQWEEKVAGIAQRIWEKSLPAVQHAYLQAKDVLAHWLRQDRQGNLLVPMQDETGKIWNLQTIGKDGTKMFGVTITQNGNRERVGGRKQGLYAVIGGLEPGKPVAIGEGYSTAATFYETTGIPTAVAFDSGNLMPVAKAIPAEDPDRKIIFAADNDHHLPRREPPLPNVGLEKAFEAAKEVGGLVIAPKFEPHDKGTD